MTQRMAYGLQAGEQFEQLCFLQRAMPEVGRNRCGQPVTVVVQQFIQRFQAPFAHAPWRAGITPRCFSQSIKMVAHRVLVACKRVRIGGESLHN